MFKEEMGREPTADELKQLEAEGEGSDVLRGSGSNS